MSDKKKRIYKCGGCGELGHNKRTCPNKEGAIQRVVAVEEPPIAAEPEVVEEKEEAHVQPQMPLDGSVDLINGFRKPTGRPVAPAAPYECAACGRVGILVLVELVAGGKALRCEHCQNKTPVKTILRWGATPDTKVV